ncbi:GGDEF domain-containing protein [Caballeronia sp. LjRoot29]|uniref:GGDEF domain-containing protein n=1 Tax=Caballeronia sp. LjRoot29 TaxID=3342315 RepID=UPI003ECEABE0
MFSPVALYVVGIMSGVISAVVFGSLLRSRIPGLFRWIGANLLIVAALVALAFSDSSPPPLVVVAASSLFAGSAFLVLQGCRLFFGLQPSRHYEVVAFVLLAVGIVHWTYFSPNAGARIVVMSGFLAYVRLMVAWITYTKRPPHRPGYSYQFVAIIAALGGFVHIARGLAAGLGWEHHTRFLEPTPMTIAFLALGIVTLPCLSIGALMLAYDRMAERMERLAAIDELTGALVRREFMAQAESQLERANRTKIRLTVAILDIDNFKAVNDAHGHAAGDRALAHFSSIVSQGIRRGDIFGRLGGEEFAILFPETPKADALTLVNSLRLHLAASTVPVPQGELSCTFSAGVDEYQADEMLANLMARADAALYSAKAMGRNRVVSAVSFGDETAGATKDAPEPT